MHSSKRCLILWGLVIGLVTDLSDANTALGQTAASTAAPAAPSKSAQRAQNYTLRKAVRHALEHTQRLDQSHITIVTRSGHVTLEGSVPDGEQIQLAETAAQGVQGVTNVTNDLHIDEPGR